MIYAIGYCINTLHIPFTSEFLYNVQSFFQLQSSHHQNNVQFNNSNNTFIPELMTAFRMTNTNLWIQFGIIITTNRVLNHHFVQRSLTPSIDSHRFTTLFMNSTDLYLLALHKIFLRIDINQKHRLIYNIQDNLSPELSIQFYNCHMNIDPSNLQILSVGTSFNRLIHQSIYTFNQSMIYI